MPDTDLHTILLRAYASESETLLERIAAALVELDHGTVHPNDVLHQLSRHLHTLKGAAATVEREDVIVVCQALEDFIQAPITGVCPLTRDAIESLRRTIHVLVSIHQHDASFELEPVLRGLEIDRVKRPTDIRACDVLSTESRS